MSSTTLSTYNTPGLTERCGEVYCSLNLERFFINCLRCSHQFTLLSCDLFVKHIQECLPAVLHDLAEQDSISQKSHDLESNNLTIDGLETTDCAIQQIQIDPLMTIKHESEEVYNADDACEDAENPSDYENDDDLSLEKLRARKIVEGVISEYKKHPILWDIKLKSKFKRAEVTRAYRRIRRAVNLKYKTNFSHIQLRTQIQNLRCRYRKVLDKKKAFDKCRKDGAKHFETGLWFFDKLSFIDETNQEYKDDLSQGGESEQDDSTSSNESFCSSNDSPGRRVKRIKRDRPSSKMLNETDIILDIISQYKQYPFLWDQTSPLYRVRYAKADAFRQITTHINQKFNKDVTDKELRQQVFNLRAAYKHVQREKHKPNYQITLWYYNELSFIDSKADVVKNAHDNPHLKPIKQEEALNLNQMHHPDNNHYLGCEQSFEPSHHDQRKNGEKESKKECENDDLADDSPAGVIDEPLSSNKKIVLSLIEEYKKHPCLWNSHECNTKTKRCRAVKEITSAINTIHKANFTSTKIQNKLVHLRRSYKRALRNKETFGLSNSDTSRIFEPPLWYFNHMSFIGDRAGDLSLSRMEKKKPDLGDESQVAVMSDEDIHSDNHSECLSMKSEPWQISITENKPLLKAIIGEYKRKPSLWAVNSEESMRQRELTDVCNVISEKFSTKLNCQSLDSEMSALISSYKRTLQTQEAESGNEANSKVWYADLLTFINNSKTNETCDKQRDLPEEKSATNDNNSSDDEEEYQSSGPVPNKEMVFKIIELYKEATSLWDTNHPQHKMQSERRRRIGAIIARLSQEHDIHITVEEFRYHIQFLKSAYFRAVRQEAIAKQSNLSSMGVVEKPFYFDEMSFLEPFADKNAADLQITDDKPHQFTFLCENKSLMMGFINLYKASRCLWDQEHKDRNNPAAHSKAHRKIIKLFKQNGEHFPKKRLLSAIRFLHSTVVDTQETCAPNEANSANKSPVWFYEHLDFLGKIPPIRDMYCTHCDKHFSSLVEYEKHKIEIIGDYPYKCKICNAGFVSRSKFSYHQITHKEPHKCELCGFQAFDNHNFNVHMRRHKRIHMFRCDECDKGFVTSSELNRHLRKHTGEKSFVCEICGMALVASSEYNHHMKRHRNERDHKCEICGSAFFTAKTLRCHMASHSSERQHVCDVCGSAFKRKKTLCQHMALHSENKKYGCNICGRRFAQKSGLHSHMKTHGQKI